MSSVQTFFSNPLAAVLRFVRWWVALSIIIAGLTLTLAIAHVLKRDEAAHIRRQVKTDAEAVSRAIEGSLSDHIETVIQIARHWEIRKPTMNEWEADARISLAQHHGLEGIEWVDSSFQTRWAVYSGVKRSVGPETALGEPREIAFQKVQHSGPTITRVLDLPQRGTGIQLYVPILPDSNRYRGLIIAIVNVQSMMTGLLDVNLWRRYEMEIFEGTRLIYTRPGSHDETKKEWAQNADMDLYGVASSGGAWKIRLWPTSAWFDEMHSPLHGVVRAAGAVMTMLLALLAYWVRLARNSTLQLQGMNANLRKEIAERLQAQAALADFTAMIVHDLRAPFSNVTSIAMMMRDGVFGPISPEQAEWLGKIESSTRGAVDLISDMLDVSKLEAGRIELRKESVDLGQILRGGLDGYALEARKKGISLREEISPLLPRILADPRRLEQVMTNLLSNALKFSEAGTVTVSARFTGNNHRQSETGGAEKEAGAENRCSKSATDISGRWIEVKVADTGMGIAPEEIGQIFQKFKQTASGANSRQKGTGLGLVICKMIVEAHGGKIWAESEPKKATTFTFTLPAS